MTLYSKKKQPKMKFLNTSEMISNKLLMAITALYLLTDKLEVEKLTQCLGLTGMKLKVK